MKLLIYIILFSFSSILFSQENVDEQIKFDFNQLLSTIEYPENIKFDKAKVVLKIYVNKRGKVEKTEIISSDNNELNQVIEDAIKKYDGFTPARKNGQFVDYWIKVPFLFSKSDGKLTRMYNANPEIEDIQLDKMPEVDLNKLMGLVKYPEDAYKQKIEGKVIASVLIDEEGKASEIKIISSDNIMLNASAINAINEYGKFEPAEKDSKKVKSWVSIPFTFVYAEKEKVIEKKVDDKLENAVIDFSKLSKFVKYPEIAREKEIEGQVILKVLVNEKGKFVNILIEESDNELLNEAAIKAVKDYGKAEKPALKNGKPNASWIFLPIKFKLK